MRLHHQVRIIAVADQTEELPQQIARNLSFAAGVSGQPAAPSRRKQFHGPAGLRGQTERVVVYLLTSGTFQPRVAISAGPSEVSSGISLSARSTSGTWLRTSSSAAWKCWTASRPAERCDARSPADCQHSMARSVLG